jgi:hypothetical protein
MSEEAARAWQDLCTEFARFARNIDRTASVHVNSTAARHLTQEVAQHYFRRTRALLGLATIEPHLASLDMAFQTLLHLTSGRNTTQAYRKQIKTIRKTIPTITGLLEMSMGEAKPPSGASTADHVQIITTLEGLVPSAALSYQQAVVDLRDDARTSFRGAAAELREALREVLDHLAPDKEVMAAQGFKLEKDRAKPTMKQKVRFILRARGQGATQSAVPEDTATSIDAMIGQLARSVYDRSSLATHVASERKNVIQLKRYVDAVLYDILEL